LTMTENGNDIFDDRVLELLLEYITLFVVNVPDISEMTEFLHSEVQTRETIELYKQQIISKTELVYLLLDYIHQKYVLTDQVSNNMIHTYSEMYKDKLLAVLNFKGSSLM